MAKKQSTRSTRSTRSTSSSSASSTPNSPNSPNSPRTPRNLEQKVQALRDLVGTEVQRYTPLGSTAKAQNGHIDMAILNGVTTLDGLIQALGTPATRKSNPNDKGKAALRVKEHLAWYVSAAKTHGGVLHAFSRVHKYPKGKMKQAIKLLEPIYRSIKEEFEELYDSKGHQLAVLK